jgi:hypothetical protein
LRREVAHSKKLNLTCRYGFPGIANKTTWSRSRFPHTSICERLIYSWIPGIYKSLTDTLMWKSGTRPLSFIYGYVCFEFLVQFLCSVRQQRAENCLFPRVCLYCMYCPPQGEKEDERGMEALYCLTSGPLYCRVCRYCPPQGEKEDERGTEALYCLTSEPLYCRVQVLSSTG